MEDGRWKMEDGRWEMGDGRWEMGDGRWEMGDGRWKMGSIKCCFNITYIYCVGFCKLIYLHPEVFGTLKI